MVEEKDGVSCDSNVPPIGENFPNFHPECALATEVEQKGLKFLAKVLGVSNRNIRDHFDWRYSHDSKNDIIANLADDIEFLKEEVVDHTPIDRMQSGKYDDSIIEMANAIMVLWIRNQEDRGAMKPLVLEGPRVR